MPKRVTYDVEKIVGWLNEGATWYQIDKKLGKSEGNTARWLKKNEISILKTPPFYHWVTLDKQKVI